MKKFIAILSLAAFIFGCEIDEQINPNAPAVVNIITAATEADMNNLVVGVLARMRNSHPGYVTATGTITRELYIFDADPRNTTDLIGTTGSLDNDSFYTTANWTNRYRTIKNCNLILDALPNAILSDAKKDAYSGFAKTMMAQQFLILYSAYFDSGIRTDVSDPKNLGPAVTDAGAVLTFIRDLLDEANTDLAGSDFSLVLTGGFAGFDDAAGFGQFNRAIAARAAVYDGDMTDALTHLGNSFFDLAGGMSTGVGMDFSTNGGDLLNDLFKVPQQNGNQIIVSDTWVNEAQVGDTRVTSKSAVRDTPSAKSGINGTNETRLYASATSSISVIRNEELLLIYAEANIGTDNAAALVGLNAVRSAAGLADFVGTVTVNDVLIERRYSLWGEGHRMVDLRRTGNLNDTYVTLDPIVVDGTPVTQIIYTQFPLPLEEVGN